MTRHVRLVEGTFRANDNETTTDSLAKAIYDTINGKTLIAVSAVPVGTGARMRCVVCYDD
jgi:hypothetical protein